MFCSVVLAAGVIDFATKHSASCPEVRTFALIKMVIGGLITFYYIFESWACGQSLLQVGPAC